MRSILSLLGKKRVTCLLGAGATIPVGGPKTSELTNAARARTISVPDPVTNVWSDVAFLDQVAIELDKFLKPAQSNFEDIFDTLENLQSFYSGWQSQTAEKFKPRVATFLQPKNPKWFNQMWLLAGKRALLEAVADQIDASIARFQPHGEHAWFRLFWSRAFENAHWDIGTLNYDNLLEQINPKLEDGYDGSVVAQFSRDRLVRAKASRILHLHGSIHYGYSNVNPRPQFTNFWEDLIRYPSPAEARGTWFGRSTAVSQSHQDLVIGPLITGLRKTDKLTVHPYDDYQAEFRRAIYGSRSLLIMGYSFGDLYLNSILNRMLGVHGAKRRIVIVTWFPGKPQDWHPDPKVLFQDHGWPNVDMFEAFGIAMNSTKPLGSSMQYSDKLVSKDACSRLYLGGTQQAIESYGADILNFLTG